MAGKPKLPFFLAVGLVVICLVGFGVWRFFLAGNGGNADADNGPGVVDSGPDGDIDIQDPVSIAEDSKAADFLTAKEFTVVPQERLFPVKGASEYADLGDDNTVIFSLNVWAGWAPIIYANEGGAAKKIWKTPDGKEFKVRLKLADDPTAMLDSYVAGDSHIGWATLDMLPLFMERMVDADGNPNDSRIMPRVFQQVDWSAGGDGIVVRENIKTVQDLRGKKIVLAQNSPSHYFVLNMLVAGGVQPREVKFTFTGDAFEAATQYATDNSISACASWAPDIYNLADSPGNRMLVDTVSANRLIADVWFARADFAKDHPDIIEGLVRGIFNAMDEINDQKNLKTTAKYMSELYNIPETETEAMLADAYSTRWGDNYQFMVNENYLANFERVWDRANYLYRKIGVLEKPKTPFDRIMDNTIIKKLGLEDKYKQQKVQTVNFPTSSPSGGDGSNPVLTATHFIRFFPNDADPYKKIFRKNDEGKDVEELYDPNVDFVLEEIADQIGQFEFSRVRIEGHADASMRGQVDEQIVLELSQKRADAVQEALLKKFKQLDPKRFQAVGRGWREPADPNRPNDHAKNRRVEVEILPAEGQ